MISPKPTLSPKHPEETLENPMKLRNPRKALSPIKTTRQQVFSSKTAKSRRTIDKFNCGKNTLNPITTTYIPIILTSKPTPFNPNTYNRKCKPIIPTSTPYSTLNPKP